MPHLPLPLPDNPSLSLSLSSLSLSLSLSQSLSLSLLLPSLSSSYLLSPISRILPTDAAVALELALLKAQPGNETLGQPAVWGSNDVPRYTIFQRLRQAVLLKEKEREGEREKGSSSDTHNTPYADWKSGTQGTIFGATLSVLVLPYLGIDYCAFTSKRYYH